MPTRLTTVVVDAADPQPLARWWAQALGWRVTEDGPEESVAEPPEGEPGLPLVFVRVDDERRVKNRVHLDLRTGSPEQQQELVQRLLAAGASRADVGQVTSGPGAVRFVVLADPEGNEFCVLEPRETYGPETGAVAAVVLDAAAPGPLARFWQQATGWDLVDEGTRSATLWAPDRRGPQLELLEDPTPRAVKNRVHLDVAPYPADDQQAEVARLCDAGARPVEVGQSSARPGEVTWVVLADPEGNELCVLSPR